jgi:hypothetical protein
MSEKKKNMKRKIFRILLIFAIVSAAYNAVWFGWSRIRYGKLTDGMEKADFSSFIVPRYIFTDDEGYDYLVKYPDYLSFSGNMSVGLPAVNENPFRDALNIWPKINGQYELGVLLYDADGSQYAVYIDDDGNALSEEDKEAVSRHKEAIKDLLNKADEKWSILEPRR